MNDEKNKTLLPFLDITPDPARLLDMRPFLDITPEPARLLDIRPFLDITPDSAMLLLVGQCFSDSHVIEFKQCKIACSYNLCTYNRYTQYILSVCLYFRTSNRTSLLAGGC